MANNLVKRAKGYLDAREALEKESTFAHTPNAMLASFVWRGVLHGYSALQTRRFSAYVETHPEDIAVLASDSAITFTPRQLAEVVCSRAVEHDDGVQD